MIPSGPRVACALCGRIVPVSESVTRSFPPDVARRKLRRACAAHNCECEPRYYAGVRP